MNKKQKSLTHLVLFFVFMILLVVSCFKFSQIMYIQKKLSNEEGNHPPWHSNKYEERISKRCVKEEPNIFSIVICKINKVRKHFIIWLVLIIVSFIIIIRSLRKLNKK